MAGLGKGEARLTALNPEPAREHDLVIIAPDLSAQRPYLAGPFRGLPPVQQQELYFGSRHRHLKLDTLTGSGPP